MQDRGRLIQQGFDVEQFETPVHRIEDTPANGEPLGAEGFTSQMVPPIVRTG